MLTWVMAASIGLATNGESAKDCQLRIAYELEVSKEAASEIADAAVSACVHNEVALSRTNLIKLRRAISRSRLQLAVVRYRACKKTPDCNPADSLDKYYPTWPRD